MDFSTNYTLRTDLADEVLEGLYGKRDIPDDGITFESTKPYGVNVDFVHVKNVWASKKTGKPAGRYVTVDTGEIWKKDASEFEKISRAVSEQVGKMLPRDGLCLVVCLGNSRISADAVGPMTANNLIVTRHIKMQDVKLFDSMGLRECACVVPGVMGDTGAEAAELVKGTVETLKPSAVIAVDALACRKLSRLATTVQISDTGISPGSGIGNTRSEISEKTLGVPTIAIGVPTVVEAATLTLDLLKNALGEEREVYEFAQKRLSENPSDFFVSPKETDKIIKSMARLVGYSINLALHGDISISEMDEFLA